MAEETDKKLSMSLDDLIKKRKGSGLAKRNQAQKGGQGQGSATQQSHSANGHTHAPPGNTAHRPPSNGDLRQRPQGFTNSGLIMPNFGMPFGSFPPYPMQMAPMVGQGPMGGLNGARPPFPGMPLPPNMMPPSGMNPSARPFIPSVEPPSIVSVPQARLEKVSGEVRVSFRKQDIVRVSKDGNMVIDTKGVRGPAIFMALNAILKVVDVSISRAKNAKPEDEWSVSDGRSLTRYRDGMTLPGRGYEAKLRGKKIMDSFGEVDPSAAAAATAASNAAARAAGIFPKTGRHGDPGADSPDSGRKLGLHPLGGRPGPRSAPLPPEFELHQHERQPNARPQGSGGKSQAEHDRIRRLAAKGRYRPY